MFWKCDIFILVVDFANIARIYFREMDGVDPDTLLEWLQMGVGDERDLQVFF